MNEIVEYKPSRAVEIRRRMCELPQVVAALDNAELSVLSASTGMPISAYTDYDLGVELVRALKYVQKDVGYRDNDSESERGYFVFRLSEILKRYYSTLTIRDFLLAFEMCIAGELDSYLPKNRDGQPDRGHYQQFNAEYICKVLNAYKSRRSAILGKAVAALPEPEPARDLEEEQRQLDQVKADLLESFSAYCATGKIPQLSPIAEMLYYDLLSGAGLAEPVEVTEADQREIFERTLNAFSWKGEVGQRNRAESRGPGAPELQPAAFKLSRRKALEKVFAELREKGVILSELL